MHARVHRLGLLPQAFHSIRILTGMALVCFGGYKHPRDEIHHRVSRTRRKAKQSGTKLDLKL